MTAQSGFLASVVLSACFLLVPGIAQEKGRVGKEKIEGCWTVSKVIVAGDELPPSAFEKSRFCFEKDAFVEYDENRKLKESKKYAFVVVGEMSSIDFYLEGKVAAKAIITMDTNQLLICVGTSEQDRPTQFESTNNNKYVLFRFDRAK